MDVPVYVQVCANVDADALRIQKRPLAALELESWVAVSHLIWVLRTELWSSARAVHILNHGTIFPAHTGMFLKTWILRATQSDP